MSTKAERIERLRRQIIAWMDYHGLNQQYPPDRILPLASEWREKGHTEVEPWVSLIFWVEATDLLNHFSGPDPDGFEDKLADLLQAHGWWYVPYSSAVVWIYDPADVGIDKPDGTPTRSPPTDDQRPPSPATGDR